MSESSVSPRQAQDKTKAGTEPTSTGPLASAPAELSHDADKPVAVLLLDGGGVRGLSSLVILQRLMSLVNAAARSNGFTRDADLSVKDVFDVVAGTSTGGLIAIMMGKMGMSIDECIDAYRNLSKEVFGSKRTRGILSLGLARARYRGSSLTTNVKLLLRQRQLSEDLPMVRREGGNDPIKCAVVCREHEGPSKYSALKPNAVRICSSPCQEFDCTVCDAARATSAAFTYFPIKHINGRYFSDGGVQNNNPTFAIWDHYTLEKRTQGRNRNSQISVTNEPAKTWVNHAAHAVGTFENVTLVNIGTGSNMEDTPERRREKFRHLLPGMIRMGIFLKEALSEVATNAERDAEFMRAIVKTSSGKLRFTRLSASTGVCWIKLDRHKELDAIVKLTEDWLAKEPVVQKMENLASALAKEYMAKQ